MKRKIILRTASCCAFLRTSFVASTVLTSTILTSTILSNTLLYTSTLQAMDSLSEQSTDEIPVISVTATRTANTEDETLAPVSIITREDIERLQVKSVSEILSFTPGIDVTQSGGYGSTTGIFIRGTNSSHVLTLIDGVKIGSSTLGTTAFQNLPIDQIERIEIVRGPRASLYGAGAIGGVIQIFTRKGNSSEGITSSIEAGYGTENTSKLSGTISGGNKNSNYSLGLSAFNTEGYNFVGDPNGQDHGYDNLSLSLAGSHQLSSDISINGNFLRSQGNTEFDGSFQNNTDYVEQVVGLGLDSHISEQWDMSFKINQSQSNSDNYLDDTFSSTFDSKTNAINWQNDIVLNDDNLLTLGVDYTDDIVNSTTNYDQTSRDNVAAFAQYQLFAEKFDIIGSLRHDDNESYGNHDTGNISLGMPINDLVRAVVSYGTAFKAPTFNDLYYPGFGNPDLEAETSKSFDISLNGAWQHGIGQKSHWRVNYFQTTIDNFVYYDSTTYSSKSTDAKIKGLEFGFDTVIYDWNLNANYTLMDPKNQDNGKLLARRSEQLFNLQAYTSVGKFNYGASIKAASERFDDANEQNKLAGYGIANLHLDYKIDKSWIVKASIDNIFDKEYATSGTFNYPQVYIAPGRTAMLSLKFIPK